MQRSALIAAVAFSLALSTAAHAFVITPVYADPTVWTADQMAVISAAADDWTSRLALDNGNNQDIHVNFTQISDGTAPGAILAAWFSTGTNNAFNTYSSSLTHHIEINTSFSSVESYSLAPPTPGANQYDMFTVILHEMGHALGFYSDLYFDQGVNRWTSLISNGAFDPGGLNVPMDDDNNHVDLPSDLMYFSLPTDSRKDISDTDIAMLSRAYGFSALPVPEPASLSLLALGAFTLLTRRRPIG